MHESINPIISFLVCTRNRAETVRECVLNLLNSGRSDIEVIVRDNSSEDNTLELLSNVKDSRFKLYQAPENQGTRNFFEIAKLATGKIITWLSDEDDFQFEHLDFVISQFDNPACNAMFGSIIVGNGHQVIFPDAEIDNLVNANLAALRFSGCGGVFVRKSILHHNCMYNFKASNDYEAYTLWNYYPIGFFATLCLENTLFTTSRIVVKQARNAPTNNNWSLNSSKSKRKLPHYYPESVFDRLSSSITNVIYKEIMMKDKIAIILRLLKGFYLQANAYKHPGLIKLLNENYDSQIVRKYVDHINNLKLDNVVFKNWYLLRQTAKLFTSVYSTFNDWLILQEK